MIAPTTQAKRKRVFLVEDHRMFREQLTHLINREAELTVCGEAEDVVPAFEQVSALRPDIVLLDLSLKSSHGLDLIREIRFHGLDVPLLVLSMHDEEVHAEKALRAGARGYVSKNEASSTLLAAIRKVLAGDISVSRSVNAILLSSTRTLPASLSPELLQKLTPREIEVFRLMGQGNNSHATAEALGLSESTVETYRSRIKDKLRLRSAAELYLRAAQWNKDDH
jgi:DNA-binding NarL/FixJ family response regulator